MSNAAMPPKEKSNGIIRRVTKLWDFVDSANRLTFFVAIRRGLALTIPLMIIGSLSVFVNNLPIAAYQEAMLSIFGEGWKDFGDHVNQATMGIMSICVNLSIGYTLAESRHKPSQEIHPMMGALVSLICLFTLMRMDGPILDWFDAKGLFIAIITAFVATRLFLFFCRFKRLHIKLYSNAAENHFTTAVSALVPFALTVIFFDTFRSLLALAGIEDIHASIYGTLSGVFTADSSPFLNCIVLQLLIHVLWFFGIHGHSVLQPLARSILTYATHINTALVVQEMPPTEIINGKFVNTFINLGGSGATLCLIIAIFIGMRRSNTRRVAGISILPALINVNEVMVFGIPIVLNLYLLIPFVTLPVILVIISYAATAIGLVPIAAYDIAWTTPIFFSGYIATGSIAGSFLQLFNLAVGTLVYLPFVRMYERSMDRDNKRALSGLTNTVFALDELRRTVLLDRRDAEGNMARALASDLPSAMQTGEICLNYQPLVSEDGTVFGVEALLRWQHKRLGYIPPPVVIAVAEESDMIHRLGMWIFETAIKALRDFRDGGMDIGISINITPSQLDNSSLAKEVMELVERYGLMPGLIDIEITEQTALGGLNRLEAIHELRELGFHVAIDDFGMGHGSLTYLKDLDLDIIKIDGALVRDIETNASCRDIISTITGLSRTMNIRIIAEFVENEQQRGLLRDMGCTCYQGYLYSPALSFEDAAAYIMKRNGVMQGSVESTAQNRP